MLKRYYDFKDKIVLEVGCGGGDISSLLAEDTQQFVGIDPDAATIHDAQKKYKHVDFRVGHGESLAFADNLFDDETDEIWTAYENLMKSFFTLEHEDTFNASVVLITYQFVASAPPKTLHIATASKQGAYYRFAEEYGLMQMHISCSKWIILIQVAPGFDEADNEIVNRVSPDDIVITSDIPLAAQVLEKGGHALNPRGELYSRDTIQGRVKHQAPHKQNFKEK